MPLKEVEKFEKQLEKQYAKWWITATDRKRATKLRTLQRLFQDEGFLARLAAGRASRLRKLLPGLVFIAALSQLTEAAQVGAAIARASNDPNLAGPLNNMLGAQRVCIALSLEGRLRNDDAAKFLDRTREFMEAVGIQDSMAAAAALSFMEKELSKIP